MVFLFGVAKFFFTKADFMLLQFPIYVQGAQAFCSNSGSQLSCDFAGSLLQNASVTLAYSFVVKSVSEYTSVSTNAVVLSNVYDPRMDNNMASAIVTIGPCGPTSTPTSPPTLPPVAANDSFFAFQDLPFTASVVVNDTTYGKPFTTTLIAPIGGSIGIVAMNQDGTFTLIPTRLFVGNIFFQYRLCNSAGCAAIANVTVVIQPTPTFNPVANDDFYTIVGGSTLSAFVTVNDQSSVTNPAGAAVTPIPINTFLVSLLIGPTPSTLGSLILFPTGNFVFTPANSFVTGKVVFQYVLCETVGNRGCSVANVTITLTTGGTNLPIANPDFFSVNQGSSLKNVSITQNDVSSSGVTPIPPGSFVVSVLVPPVPSNIGVLTLRPDGFMDFVPNIGAFGIVTYVYQLCESGNRCASAVVTIDVVHQDQFPIANPDLFFTLQRVPLSGSVVLNDTSSGSNPQGPNQTPPPAGTFVVSLIVGVNSGQLTLYPNGTFRYVPTLNFNGTVVFTYKLCETVGQMLCASTFVNIQVGGIFDFPIARADSYTSYNLQSVVGVVTSNDTSSASNSFGPNVTSIPSGSYTVTVVSFPSVGSLDLAIDGTFGYIPTALGIYQFEYRLCEVVGDLLCANAFVTLNILSQRLPIARDDTYTMLPSSSISRAVVLNDTSSDGFTPIPAGTFVTTLAGSPPASGTLVLTIGGTFFYEAPSVETTVFFFYNLCETVPEFGCSVAKVTIIVANPLTSTVAPTTTVTIATTATTTRTAPPTTTTTRASATTTTAGSTTTIAPSATTIVTLAPTTRTTTRPVSTTSPATTTSQGGDCLVVEASCAGGSNRTRLDSGGYYCAPFSSSSFVLRFSCSSTNSFDVFTCLTCTSGCVLDAVTKTALGLDQYDGQLGGAGQCLALPLMVQPGQIRCEPCPASTTAPATTTTVIAPTTTASVSSTRITTVATSTVPISTTTTRTTTSVATTAPAPPSFCLNLTSPCGSSSVVNLDSGGKYCFQMQGPPSSPLLSIGILCSGGGQTLTTQTCATTDCSSGCTENPAWASILGLNVINPSGSGQCVSVVPEVPGVPNPSKYQCVVGPCFNRSTVATTTVGVTTSAVPSTSSTTKATTTVGVTTSAVPSTSATTKTTTTTPTTTVRSVTTPPLAGWCLQVTQPCGSAPVARVDVNGTWCFQSVSNGVKDSVSFLFGCNTYNFTQFLSLSQDCGGPFFSISTPLNLQAYDGQLASPGVCSPPSPNAILPGLEVASQLVCVPGACVHQPSAATTASVAPTTASSTASTTTAILTTSATLPATILPLSTTTQPTATTTTLLSTTALLTTPPVGTTTVTTPPSLGCGLEVFPSCNSSLEPINSGGFWCVPTNTGQSLKIFCDGTAKLRIQQCTMLNCVGLCVRDEQANSIEEILWGAYNFSYPGVCNTFDTPLAGFALDQLVVCSVPCAKKREEQARQFVPFVPEPIIAVLGPLTNCPGMLRCEVQVDTQAPILSMYVSIQSGGGAAIFPASPVLNNGSDVCSTFAQLQNVTLFFTETWNANQITGEFISVFNDVSRISPPPLNVFNLVFRSVTGLEFVAGFVTLTIQAQEPYVTPFNCTKSSPVLEPFCLVAEQGCGSPPGPVIQSGSFCVQAKRIGAVPLPVWYKFTCNETGTGFRVQQCSVSLSPCCSDPRDTQCYCTEDNLEFALQGLPDLSGNGICTAVTPVPPIPNIPIPAHVFCAASPCPSTPLPPNFCLSMRHLCDPASNQVTPGIVTARGVCFILDPGANNFAVLYECTADGGSTIPFLCIGSPDCSVGCVSSPELSFALNLASLNTTAPSGTCWPTSARVRTLGIPENTTVVCDICTNTTTTRTLSTTTSAITTSLTRTTSASPTKSSASLTTIPASPTTASVAPTTASAFPTTASASPTTTPAPGACLVVKSSCDASQPQTRLDQDGFYCVPFADGTQFSFRFSCSLTLPNSIDVYACGENCSSLCGLDPVTKATLGLGQYDGLLGGNGQCFLLPGMATPGQISCEVISLVCCCFFFFLFSFQACPVSTAASLTSTSVPLTTTAATTTASTSITPTTLPSGFCLNLTSPCNGSSVVNYGDGAQYCFEEEGPPGSPKLAISLICTSDGRSITTATCSSPTCSSGCVFNPVWAFILGLDSVNASDEGECIESPSQVPGVPNPARYQCVRGPCPTRTTITSTTSVSTTLTTVPITTIGTLPVTTFPTTTDRTASTVSVTTIGTTTTVPVATVTLPSIAPTTVPPITFTVATVPATTVPVTTLTFPTVPITTVTFPTVPITTVPITFPTVPTVTFPTVPITTVPITFPTVPITTVTFPTVPPVTFPTLATVTFPTVPPVTFPTVPTVTFPTVPITTVPITFPTVPITTVTFPTVPPVTFPSLATVTFPTVPPVTFPTQTTAPLTTTPSGCIPPSNDVVASALPLFDGSTFFTTLCATTSNSSTCFDDGKKKKKLLERKMY
jgi:hypothetical protein